MTFLKRVQYTVMSQEEHGQLCVFFILVNSLYLLLMKMQTSEAKLCKGYNIATAFLILVMDCGFWLYGGGYYPRARASIIHCIRIYLDNPYFMPDSTIHLSKNLEELSRDEGEQLRVISPEWMYPDGALHRVAAC